MKVDAHLRPPRRHALPTCLATVAAAGPGHHLCSGFIHSSQGNCTDLRSAEEVCFIVDAHLRWSRTSQRSDSRWRLRAGFKRFRPGTCVQLSLFTSSVNDTAQLPSQNPLLLRNAADCECIILVRLSAQSAPRAAQYPCCGTIAAGGARAFGCGSSPTSAFVCATQQSSNCACSRGWLGALTRS
jgi:hypothetical protein